MNVMSPLSCRSLTPISQMPCVRSTAQRESLCRCVGWQCIWIHTDHASLPPSLSLAPPMPLPLSFLSPAFLLSASIPSFPSPPTISPRRSSHHLLLQHWFTFKGPPGPFLVPSPTLVLLWPPLASSTPQAATSIMHCRWDGIFVGPVQCCFS